MTKEQRHVQLSWQLLEYKCYYYLMATSKIDDYAYDMLEQEYDGLCLELNLPNSVGDMVDFDTNRPACKLVMLKLGAIGAQKRKKK